MKNFTTILLFIVVFLVVQTSLLKAQFNELFSETIIDTRTLDENSYLLNIMGKFGDYDNDGDLDILALESIMTFTDSSSYIYIYSNQNNIYTKNLELAIIHVAGESVYWFDYDNDGDLDIVFSGSTEAEYVPITKIYQNTGNGFTEVFNYDLTSVMWGSMDFGDYDNDGDLDILLTGREMIKIYEEYEHVTKIYQNTGNGFNEVFDIIGGAGQADWADFNNDGKLDIVISGIDTYFNNVSKLYFNTGSGFTEVYAGSIAASGYNSIACSDYDNDGDIDFLLGSILYQNTGNGFSEIYNGIFSGEPYSTAWGDYDNDGDLDVILSGSNIYRNDGNGFSKINIDILNSFSGRSCWGDYDNDGDLDFLNFDFDENENIILRIFRNITEKPNIPAVPPANTNSTVSGANVTLTWDKATDTETSQNGLSYTILVYKDEIKGLSRKLVAKAERIQYSATGYTLKNLSNGNYYWQVQAFDTGLKGGEFSEEKTFIISIPTPTYYSNAEICEGESYIFGTQELFDAGEYSETFVAANGSDSTVILTLTVNPTYFRTESSTLCSGESFLFPDGTTQSNITSQVVHISSMQTILGCDSIIETTVNINPVYNLFETYSVNSGESVIFPDGFVQDNITSQFIHVSYLQTVFGCDSIIQTTVNVSCDEVYNYFEDVTVCEGSNYTFPDGTIENNITSEIIHVSNLKNTLGCDSIIETTVNIEFLSVPDFSYECDSTRVLFKNESLYSVFYFWDFGDGATSFSENPIHVYPELGEYTVRLKSINNCMSQSIYKTIEVVYIPTNVENAGENEIRVYPNPTNGLLTISNLNQFSKNDDLNILIQTIEGITVYQERIPNENDSEAIDVSLLSNGFYILKIQTTKNTALIRFVKN